MDKETASAPEFDSQPPPYSEFSPPNSIPVQPIAILIRDSHQHHNLQHQGDYNGHGPVTQMPIVTQQPGETIHVVTGLPPFRHYPMPIICNECNQTVTSKIVRHRGLGVHLCALGFCLVGCWPCVLCVYCSDSGLTTNHYCPNCNSHQGTYVRA